jgi:hypothetical protein
MAAARCEVGHLGLCRDGAPRHPLMLPYSTAYRSVVADPASASGASASCRR